MDFAHAERLVSHLVTSQGDDSVRRKLRMQLGGLRVLLSAASARPPGPAAAVRRQRACRADTRARGQHLCVLEASAHARRRAPAERERRRPRVVCQGGDLAVDGPSKPRTRATRAAKKGKPKQPTCKKPDEADNCSDAASGGTDAHDADDDATDDDAGEWRPAGDREVCIRRVAPLRTQTALPAARQACLLRAAALARRPQAAARLARPALDQSSLCRPTTRKSCRQRADRHRAKRRCWHRNASRAETATAKRCVRDCMSCKRRAGQA